MVAPSERRVSYESARFISKASPTDGDRGRTVSEGEFV